LEVNNINHASGTPWYKKILKLTKASEFTIFIVFIVLCIIIAFLAPAFLNPENLINILQEISLVGVISVGMAMVIITGGIDLSVGGDLALCAIVASELAHVINPWFAVLIAIIVGGLVGFCNGLLVEKVGITAFIATLGMMNVTRGFAYMFTRGIPVQFQNSANILGGGKIPIAGFSLPSSVIIMFAVYILGIIIMKKTVLGKNIYAVGDNEKSAHLSGIKTGIVKIQVYTITGLLCGLAGVINVGNLTTAEASAATGIELDCIAAVVIGGISMTGGEGSLVGMLIGAALMGVIRNGFILLSFPAYMQTFTIGLLIIVSVGIDCMSKKKRSIV
jgi:ribose transport system permease protein